MARVRGVARHRARREGGLKVFGRFYQRSIVAKILDHLPWAPVMSVTLSCESNMEEKKRLVSLGLHIFVSF